MAGKKIAWIGVALALASVAIAYLLMRSSTVGGQVTWKGSPVAAGQIIFESTDVKLTSQISDGRYEIRHPQLAGDYQVVIEIHFVDPSEATEFYAHLTQELNPKKNNSKEEPLLSEESSTRSQGKSNDASDAIELSSLKRFVLKEQLGNGWNVRNYPLPPDDQ